MKKLLLKILGLFLLIMALDYGFSIFLDSGRPPDYDAFIKAKKQYFKVKDSIDILFFGDSHIADAIVPEVIDSVTGMRSFNFGVYHLSPVEGYFLLKELISVSKNLKLIVLGVDPVMFNRKINEGKYTPFFIRNPLNYLYLLTASESKNLAAFTSAGKKTDLFLPAIKLLFDKDYHPSAVRNISKITSGYLENKKHCTDTSELEFINPLYDGKMKKKQIAYFIKTLDLAKQNNISVIIANTPFHPAAFRKIETKPVFHDFRKLLSAISDSLSVKVINGDYSFLKDSLQNTDFLNGEHLCYPGAVLYSNALAADIYNKWHE